MFLRTSATGRSFKIDYHLINKFKKQPNVKNLVAIDIFHMNGKEFKTKLKIMI